MSTLANDLELYERHAGAWWDDASPVFRSLRAVKGFHLELVREAVERHLGGRFRCAVDLGCGGGLLAVPLAAHGDLVVGVDRSGASLAVARDAARRRGAACVFVRGDVRDAPLEDGCADLVVASDVIEHVEEKLDVLRSAARLLRPGGVLYVNTLAHGLRARLLGVVLAEGLGFVPRGTHDARLFVRADALVDLAARVGLTCAALEGESVHLLPTLRSHTLHLCRSRDLGVSYHATFVKEGGA